MLPQNYVLVMHRSNSTYNSNTLTIFIHTYKSMVSQMVGPEGMVGANPCIEDAKYVDTLLGGDLHMAVLSSSQKLPFKTFKHIRVGA